MKRVLAILKKDLKQITRNRFIVVITFLAIFAYAAIYHLMPKKVDEKFKMGLFVEKGRSKIEKQLEQEGEEGIKIIWADSVDKLKKMVEEKEVLAGFAFTLPEGKPYVKLYVSSQTPKEITEQGRILGREFAFNLSGYKLPVEIEETIIGKDMVGQQISLRNKFRILFVIFVFLVEIYTLANVLVDEISRKTVQALLVTPVSIGEFLASKALLGITLSFSEGLLVAFMLQIMSTKTFFPVIIFLLLGAVVITGIAFVIGALGRDMFSVLGWLMLAMITLAIPAVSLTLPDLVSPWLKAIPTYFFVDALDGIVNRGFPISQFVSHIAYLVAFGLFFFSVGFFVLRRKVILA